MLVVCDCCCLLFLIVCSFVMCVVVRGCSWLFAVVCCLRPVDVVCYGVLLFLGVRYCLSLLKVVAVCIA